MSTVDNLSLMELNPNWFPNEGVELAKILDRVRHPWENDIVAPDLKDAIASDFHIDVNCHLVELIARCPYEEVTFGDLFIGGSTDDVAMRIITLTNTVEIEDELTLHDIEASPWLRELEGWGEDHEAFLAMGVHIYVHEKYNHRNSLLWDGKAFRHVRQPKHEFYVPEEEYQLEDKVVVAGGYDYGEKVKEAVGQLNRLNVHFWDSRINHEWAVGRDYDIIQNTYHFLYEVHHDALMLFNELHSKWLLE